MQELLPGAGVFAGAGDDFDSGTDSDTASSLGEREYDLQDIIHLDPTRQERDMFWAYDHAKGRWRKFTKKPARHVRIFFRRRVQGEGKGR
eukprot:1486935-Lingulodinium_polyedra.AAC.1